MAKKKPAKKTTKSNPDSSNLLVSVLVTLLIALPVGYVLGNSSTADQEDTQTTETEMSDGHSHSESDAHSDHSLFEVPDGMAAPEITELNITKDTLKGWNLDMNVSNFKFNPEKAGLDNVPGEGHAHLYIDGVKITRLYSTNYYIGELDEGEHTIRVTLNTNDHKDYAVNQKVVEATQTIVDAHHSMN